MSSSSNQGMMNKELSEPNANGESSSSRRFVDMLEELLLKGENDKVRDEVKKSSNAALLDDDGMDIIAKVLVLGLGPACTEEQIRISSEILGYLAETVNPKEVVITLLEQLSTICLESRIYYLLEPLKVALDRLPLDKLELNLKWTLEVIAKRMATMAVPDVVEDASFRLTKQSIEAAETMNGPLQTQVYIPIQGFVNFYHYCHERVAMLFGEEESLQKYHEWKNTLRLYGLKLLGSPLGLCPFEYPDKNQDYSIKKVTLSDDLEEATAAAQVGMRVAELMDDLEASVWSYHEGIRLQIDKEKEQSLKLQGTSDESDQEETEDEIDCFSLGTYFSLVYTLNLKRSGPISPTEEILTGFYLVSKMLENEHVEVQSKALKLANIFLSQLCPHSQYHRLNSSLLETAAHSNLLSNLCHAITYSDHEDIRRLGSYVFRTYLWAFDAQGRFNFVKHILNAGGYSDSILGFIITQLKEFCRQVLKKHEGRTVVTCGMIDEPILPDMEIYFSGKNLQSLIDTSTKLVNGPTTDLVSSHSQVLSALNLLRYLLLSDRRNNHSGIMNYLPDLNDRYLKDLRKALDLTVLQTQTRLKQLQDPASMEWETKEMKKNKCEMFLSDTDGAPLSMPQEHSVEEQMESCKNILSKMDMLECVLAHTMECADSATRTHAP